VNHKLVQAVLKSYDTGFNGILEDGQPLTGHDLTRRFYTWSHEKGVDMLLKGAYEVGREERKKV
jgi:hypothetical protein